LLSLDIYIPIELLRLIFVVVIIVIVVKMGFLDSIFDEKNDNTDKVILIIGAIMLGLSLWYFILTGDASDSPYL